MPAQTELQVTSLLKTESARRSRALKLQLFFAGLNLLMMSLTFWTSIHTNQEPIAIALLRCTFFGIVGVTQIVIWRKQKQEQEQRRICSRDQVSCLRTLLKASDSEVKQLSSWHAALPLLIGTSFIGLMKWIDFRQGLDTPAECLGIFVFSSFVFLALGVAMWHYRNQFAIPKRDRIRDALQAIEA